MTIGKVPDPTEPAKKLTETGKRKHAEESEKTRSVEPKLEEKKSSLIESGPFKGLPLPLQKKDYESSLPYIGCNEDGQAAALEALASKPSTVPPERRVHMGFSVWFNFDLMCVTKPAYAIICDIDNHVMDIYKAIGDCLAKSAESMEFVQNFSEFLAQNGERLFGLTSPEEIAKFFDITAELKRPNSWLSSPASFEFIKTMHQQGRILFLNLDITEGEGTFGRIKSWMESQKLELDTLYATNIVEWLPEALKQQAYVRNLQTVATPHTRFIQAYKINPKGWPVQFITQGVDNIKIPVEKLNKKPIKL